MSVNLYMGVNIMMKFFLFFKAIIRFFSLSRQRGVCKGDFKGLAKQSLFTKL